MWRIGGVFTSTETRHGYGRGAKCDEDADHADRLLGDWALALWESARRRLLLARDPLGRAPLFYHHDPTSGRLAFSTRLRSLLGLPGVRRELDDGYFAAFCRGVRSGPETPYLDLHRLAPGKLLVASEAGVEVRRYWSPARVPEVRLGSDQDYLDRFRELFREAVRCRVRSSRACSIRKRCVPRARPSGVAEPLRHQNERI